MVKFVKLFSSLFTLLGHLSPILTNVFFAWLFYRAVQFHAYPWIAGVGVYLVLSEFDSVKRDIAIYRR
jgi:hypothetical protein